MANTITLEDGRIFPVYEGEPLSWYLPLTWSDQQQGFPRLRAVIRAMAEHRPDQLERERRELVKGSLDRIFGHNARKVLSVFDEEMAVRDSINTWITAGRQEVAK